MTKTIDQDVWLRGHADVANFLEAQEMPSFPNEEFWFVSVRSDGRLLHVNRFCNGSPTKVLAPLRQAFRVAQQYKAAAVYLAHNHPQEAQPCASWNDWLSTMSARYHGWRVGIPVLDHIIMGNQDYYSYLSTDSRWNFWGWLFRVKLNPRRLLAVE